jgi:hypothetical protein
MHRARGAARALRWLRHSQQVPLPYYLFLPFPDHIVVVDFVCDSVVRFVVGYGLDYEQRLRGIPFIGVWNPAAAAAAAAAAP